jgi:hypothetical protein
VGRDLDGDFANDGDDNVPELGAFEYIFAADETLVGI